MRLPTTSFSSLVLLCTGALAVLQPTPPMGFNPWERFECAINQTLFTDTVDAMVSMGLVDAGYEYLNLDDCWPSYERTANNSLMWNETLFPQGLIYLGQYIHNHSMKFGIYSDSGYATCGGYPGSYGHEAMDAATWQSWGIDYIKLDGCNVPILPNMTMEQSYKTIYSYWHDVLTYVGNSTKQLVFSESAPAYFTDEENSTDWYTVMGWVPQYGQLARHSYDVEVYVSQLDLTNETFWESILVNYGREVRLARYQQPGYYNDPDFIIPGNPNLTLTEQKSHFALWASFSAPLIMSTYVPQLTQEEVEFLTNKDLIALDQDPLTMQATLVSQDGTIDILTKGLANGDRALTILNRGTSNKTVTVPMSLLGFSTNCTSFGVKDLWTGQNMTSSNSSVVASNIPTHGTAVYRVSPQASCPKYLPTGMIFNTASLLCMEFGNGTMVRDANCSGSSGQLWQIHNDGSIRDIDGSNCLQANGSDVVFKSCGSQINGTQQWSYSLSGNLKHVATGMCMTENPPSNNTVISSCGYELDSQVFGLPM